MVGNTFAAVFMIENTVLVKEIEKYSSCNTLVSVTEAMIFGDEIKKIGCFFFKGRVNILTAETLVDIADAAFEGIVFFMVRTGRNLRQSAFGLSDHGILRNLEHMLLYFPAVVSYIDGRNHRAG